MRRLIHIIVAASLCPGLATHASAQGFRVNGIVKYLSQDGHTETIPEPAIVQYRLLRQSTTRTPGDDPAETIAVQGEDFFPTFENGAFRFEEDLGPALDLAGKTASFFASAGDYRMSTPKRVFLETELSGPPGIPVDMVIKTNSQWSESFRREAFDVFRMDDPNEAALLRAVTAAERAIEEAPRLDNFLLAIRATRYAIQTGDVSNPRLITSLEDLDAMGGFSALSFADRWRVQSDLLDLLTSVEPEKELLSGMTYGDAALATAEQMTGQLTAETPGLATLPATRVFNALNSIHHRNDDCPSIVRTSAQATALAPALRMNWANQRQFLLEWGDCLERLGGVGNGRASETMLTDVAAEPVLVDLWAAFDAAMEPYRVNILFPTADGDKRLKRLVDFAEQVKETADGN